MNTQVNSELPLALRKHVPAFVQDDQLLGDPEQEWTWKPSGDLDMRDLAVYATGGNSTTRQTGAGQWDHGEWS
jgi:hypothetical protein